MSQQFAWGSSNPSRRGPPPISTALPSSSSSTGRLPPSTSAQSPSRSSFPPSASTQPSSSIPPSARQNISRNSSISSTTSPFSPSQGAQQAHSSQLPSSARARTIASSAGSQLASSAASLPAASTGASAASSGGGASARVARASPSLTQAAGLTASAANLGATATNQQSVSKIIITQIFMLLSSLNQEKDKAKRETQAEQIAGLISQGGMEAFRKFFRRMLQLNAEYIFSNSEKGPEGSYPLLSSYVQKIRTDPQEAVNIAEAIDTQEIDLFRNFDLSRFMEHFKMDPIAKCMLALALKHASKPDLRTKADAILSNNLQNIFMAILTPTEGGEDIPLSYLQTLIDRLIREPPRNWNDENKTNLQYAVRNRFDKLEVAMSPQISLSLQLADLLLPGNHMVKLLNRSGPHGTSSPEACRDLLASVDISQVDWQQVSSALLYMALSSEQEPYDLSVFVAAVREHSHGKRLDWQDVVNGFDLENFTISKPQFLRLYDALLPLAQEYENFDIQLLWGGQWRHPNTQLSFVVSFLSCSPEELDASSIPRLRKSFTPEDFSDASDEVKDHAAKAVKHPFVSLDATRVLFDMVFDTQETYQFAASLKVPETIINPRTDFFVLAASAVPAPWKALQETAFNQLFKPFLERKIPGHKFVFHGLWKRPNHFLVARLVEAVGENPLELYNVLEHAKEHDWIPALSMVSNAFGVDLAALAHSQNLIDIDAWLAQSCSIYSSFSKVLADMLEDNTRNEWAIQRRDPGAKPKISWSVKTVFAFLNFLQPLLGEAQLANLIRTCIQAYPRLMNYGEGFDEIIDANGRNGHSLSQEADSRMNDYYKRLYSGETSVRDIVEALQQYKQSEDPAKQELFACIINGLFDEYSCFSVYPIEALSTTAVLFGSIINFNLLSSTALQAGLSMVLEAVQTPVAKDEKMWKFGLQALKQFEERLPEWPSFCERLLRIPDLQGSTIYAAAQEVLRSNSSITNGGEASPGVANGDVDPGFEYVGSVAVVPDLPSRTDFYENPTEDVQDKVLFDLNNVSMANLKEKLGNLQQVLEEKHHRWFAEYLVDQRAKLQQNFQGLYLNLLELFGDSTLWNEVTRETFVSIARILKLDNLENSTEKVHLKSLGSWLGSITLARDVPIKERNLSFKELLIEGHASSRLTIVIPFTAKVLSAAASSEVFKPPNPWTVEILRLLLELYHHVPSLKIASKFDIEMTCSDLKFDWKTEEPSNIIRARMEAVTAMDDDYLTGIADSIDGFPDPNNMHLLVAQRARSAREGFNAAQVASSLTELSSLGSRLTFPSFQPPGSVNADTVRQVFVQASQAAITEIIAPVVERSVTIAAIAASQLVTKDFVTEPDVTKFRNSAHSMVKSLASSLASVTCHEPLRASILNSIRAYNRNLSGDLVLPEGVIIMFVNDNLETICRIISDSAEKGSVIEIDNHLREGCQLRQINANQPGDYFGLHNVNKWATYIPEPFRPAEGGLKPEQLAIYEHFGPSGQFGQIQTSSGSTQENRTQLQDLMQDQYPVPGLSTPAEGPSVGRQVHALRGFGLQQNQSSASAQVNGFAEPLNTKERAQDLLADLLRAAKDVPEDQSKSPDAAAAIRDIYAQLIAAISESSSQMDALAMALAQKAMDHLFQDAETSLEAEIAADFLAQLCGLSEHAARYVLVSLANMEDDRIFNATATLHLYRKRLIDLRRVELLLARSIHQRKLPALECLSSLLDELLLADEPSMIRADFAASFEALSQWMLEDPTFEIGKAILNKLEVQPSNLDVLAPISTDRRREIEYIFEEWVRLGSPDITDNVVAAFAHQLLNTNLMATQEELAVFLRGCLDLCVSTYENEAARTFGASPDRAYLHIDALAHLVLVMTVYQVGPDDGHSPTEILFFEKSISLIVLFQSHHFQARGENALQKAFFRFYSSLLCGIHRMRCQRMLRESMILTLGQAFLALQPKYLPGFSFGWLSLVAHRHFFPVLISIDSSCQNALIAMLKILLEYAGELVSPSDIAKSQELQVRAQDFFRAVLTFIVLLHHDFPEFLCENYIQLCDSIAPQCAQLKNLILSASPPGAPEPPNPFTAGLKVDLMEHMRANPVINTDITTPLKRAGIDAALNNAINSVDPNRQDLRKIIQAVSTDRLLIHALVVSTGKRIIESTVYVAPSETYSKSLPSIRFLHLVARELRPEARYHFLSAMVNQLRYPNSYTLYFMRALIDIFAIPSTEEVQVEVQEQITRVLMERLAVQRPHPWGVIVTLLELYKNREYHFWELPFVKASPEIERLFSSLNSYISNSPRVLP